MAQLDRGIKVWAANLAAEPRDFLSATTLAALYHERGRLTGDLADHQRALEAAQTAARVAPTEPAGRLLEAAIRYTLHDFSGAFADADALYRGDPTQLGALATRADAELELGRVGDARADYAVLSSHAAGPAVDIRLARLASVTGQPAEALRLARSARDGALAQAAAGETADVGFYQFAAGEYARLAGDAASARQGYAAALAVRDTDLGALVGLARIDAFEGRTSDAIAGLEKAAAIAPQPETLGAPGRPAGSDRRRRRGVAPVRDRALHRAAGRDREHRLRPRADPLRARPRLRHPTPLLAKARASLAARPDTSGHDTVAWALYRLGRFDEAVRPRSRPPRPTAPPTRGCCSIAARSRWRAATRPAVVPRSRPRSRSDPRSIRSSGPRRSGSSDSRRPRTGSV